MWSSIWKRSRRRSVFGFSAAVHVVPGLAAEVRDEEIGAASCRLEQWRTEAVESGSRALNQLRDGVVVALRTLGHGFTHPDNSELREQLAAGELSVSDVNHALLRVVYRLLFTFVAEDGARSSIRLPILPQKPATPTTSPPHAYGKRRIAVVAVAGTATAGRH